MFELYLLTRLDVIRDLSVMISVLSAMLFLISFVRSKCEDVEEKEKQLLRKVSKQSLIASCVSSLILILTPTTKQAFAIYGVGTTIEYIQNNEDIKQLPDKTIQALNAFLDEYIKDKEKDK